MYAICLDRVIPEIPHGVPESIKAILQRYFAFERSLRPNAGEVVDEFLKIQVPIT